MWSFERLNPFNQFKLLKAFGYWPLPVVWRLSQCLLCPEIRCHLGQINLCTFRHQQHSGAAAVWPSQTIFSSLSISIFTLPNFILHYRTWSANITTRLQHTYWPKLPWSGATEPFRDTERVTPRNGGLSPARLGHVCDRFMHAFVDRTLLPSPLKVSWHFALFTSIKPHRSCKNSSLAVWSWSRISLIRFSSRLALWESLTYFDRFGHTRTIGIVGPGFPHASTFSDPTRLRIFCDLKSFAWNEDEWRVRDLHSQIFQEKTRPGLPNARQSAALEPVPPSELQNPTVNAE